MHKTAWTKQSSSVPSDRIRPSPPPPSSNPGKNSKGKGKTAVSEPPKSKAVRHLESLTSGLSASSVNPQKDPKGGCFCQAREHTLSTYSALCRNCGLALCEINLPQYSCPHCATSLFTSTQRDALIARLEEQIAETLTKEALLRERAAEEARRAAGAFPTLGNAAPRPPPPPAAPQTRTVISLTSKQGSKMKKVTVSSFTTPSALAIAACVTSGDPRRGDAKVDPLRPWKDLSGGGAVYIPPPNLDDGDDRKGPGKKQRPNKGKAKENEAAGEPGGSRVSTNP
ncbi:zf-C2HC5 domain-containing protein [Mycena sanguinolenta]|uniref:Zf-C2HC5 domain-containing protein n=1 Tax=Mycena sanguinolenta TaxID=230812 RepID=A0A8H7CYY3_9AGAR|nr:zf-C2HC5 domain-containing protein [Mycena sanguinolenta]